MGGLLMGQTRERRDELLSAYLDGELSDRERTRLEGRLAADPALRAELEALRHTVALVRDLPSVPVPRNFILPQTMAARRRPARPPRPRRAWAAPLLTAATAVVSLAFVVVLAGELLLPISGQITSAPAAEPALEAEAPQVALAPSPVREEAVVETVEVEAEVVAEEVEKAAPTTAVAEAPAAEAPMEAAPEAPPEAEDYAAETPESAGTPEPGLGGGGPTEEPPPPAAAAPVAEESAAPLPTPTSEPEERAASPSTPGPRVVEETAEAPQADAGRVIPTPGELADVSPQVTEGEEPEATESARGVLEREAALRTGIPLRRVLEVILGLTALGLALTTVWAWRARRR